MPKPNNGPPIEEMDELTVLRDIHARVVRLETRQARQMLAQGLNSEGRPIAPRITLRPRRNSAG